MVIKTRHVICALGSWSPFQELEELVSNYDHGFEIDVKHSKLHSDDRMEIAFRASAAHSLNVLSDEDKSAILNHSSVVYILSPPMTAQSSFEISSQALHLVELLIGAGATAVKSETSGIAHGRLKWLELSRKYSVATREVDHFEQGCILYDTWVYRCVFDDTCSALYTVGMHLLGHRDIEVSPGDESVEEGCKWIDGLGYYIIGDQPKNLPAPGDSFGFSMNGKRKIFEHINCTRYEHDDFKFNPFGYYRLVEHN